MSQPLTMLDLFCGAGGMALGFARAGFAIIGAVDNEPAALNTYRTNLNHPVRLMEITEEADLPPATIVIGGPPCQGFSSAGLRRADDQRNSLVGCFAQIVAQLRPAAFVFENVEGFLTAEHGARVLDLLTPLVAAGYRIHLRKINAANYGVPQNRKRVIAIGGLGWSPTFPLPTHAAFGAPGARLAARHLTQTATVLTALRNLPPPQTQPPGVPQGHFHRPLTGKDLARAVALQPGQTMRDLPAELQHESYPRRAHRRVMDGTASARRGGAPAGIRRLQPDEPAKAITGGACTEFLHPIENRTLTLRECARLQTFPDEFIFQGTTAQQAQLIGNAVPPLLAQIIARTLARDLATATPSADEGALLSFVPTLSEGFSPVLRNVNEQVLALFTPRLEGLQLSLWD